MPYASNTRAKQGLFFGAGSAGEKLTEQALALAAEGDWSKAARVNQELLLSHPKDIRSLNRLGKCLTEMGNYKGATAAYRRTLEYDRENEIAIKNLNRLSQLAEHEPSPGSVPATARQTFVVEAGKSTIAVLSEPVNYEAMAVLSPGTEMELREEGTGLRVYDRHGMKVGALGKQLAQRLLPLMRGGNAYDVVLVSVAPGSVRVMIRETYRHPSQVNLASFAVPVDAPAAHAKAKVTALRSAGEDDDEDDDGDDDAFESVAPTGGDYPDAEVSGEERDPFADEAPQAMEHD